MPGKATIKPNIIDINAAIIDNCIVDEKPPIKNLMFVKPDWVFGFMTYHPHVPGGDEHPHNSKIKNRKM